MHFQQVISSSVKRASKTLDLGTGQKVWGGVGRSREGWVVQFSATHGGLVILFFKRNRHTFICQPKGEISLGKKSNIQGFSEKYAVDQDLHPPPCVP